MKVTVRFFGQVRQAAGKDSEILEIDPATTPRAVVQRLAESSGEPLRSHLLGDDGEVRSSLVLVIGDEQVDLDTTSPLADGDELTILPPIAGG